MSSKRILVIGSGAMGLSAVKCLKEEGFEPICYERTSHIGGLWRYHEDDVDGLASVMKSTIINSSKEMSAFSDFPPKDTDANYMHNGCVYRYLVDYARTFDVERYVQFNTEVISIKKAQDYDTTGRLAVVSKQTGAESEKTEVFDAVSVCIGHHVYPNIPNFPGQETFQGRILHTHSLKKTGPFEDQVVVVVGVGNSGMDAAVEISSVAKQVYLSTRRGAWIIPRVGPRGFPFDLFFTRRISAIIMNILPYPLSCSILEYVANNFFNHKLYNLKPNHRILSQHPSISDSLPIKILSGMVKVKKNIDHFVKNGVVFHGDDSVTECDAVVFATGYKIQFPFLDDELTTIRDNKVHLYKYVYPPHLTHPSLALIGLVQTVGAGFPAGEAQCRWVTQVLKENVTLPPKEEMERDIIAKNESNAKRYTESQRHTIQVDYIPYLDEVNDLFGAKPKLCKIFFSDPALFFTMIFGPSLPYQYRLQGPHSWPEARKTIIEWRKRVVGPLKDGARYELEFVENTSNNPFSVFHMMVFMFCAILLYRVFY